MQAATVVINRRALRHNLQRLRDLAPASKLVAVVKAPAEHFAQHGGDQHRAADHHQRQHQVVFAVAEKNGKKVGPGFHADAKNKQHKAEIKGISVNREMLLT